MVPVNSPNDATKWFLALLLIHLPHGGCIDSADPGVGGGSTDTPRCGGRGRLIGLHEIASHTCISAQLFGMIAAGAGSLIPFAALALSNGVEP